MTKAIKSIIDLLKMTQTIKRDTHTNWYIYTF